MTAISAADLIVELDDIIPRSPSERCLRMLWRTAELLIADNDRLHELQVGLIDDVLVRLLGRMTPATLAELSAKLAALRTAPTKTLRRLASYEDPAIAVPILSRSPSLSSEELIAIATSCGADHLLAIADRSNIEKSVTDVIVQRGSIRICLAVIRNPGAEFSDTGYAALIDKAGQDDEITKALVLRPGTPDAVVRALLSDPPKPATAMTAERSCAASLKSSESFRIPTVKLAGQAAYAAARPEILSLNRAGRLGDSTVNRFAIRGETANLFTALSVLSGAPIEVVEQVMAQPDCEGLVMACRASRLNWQTTLAILNNRGTRLSFGERERAQELFERLHLSTSQWSVRWGEITANAKDHPARSGESR